MYPYNRTVSRVLLALYFKLFIFNFPNWMPTSGPQHVAPAATGARGSALCRSRVTVALSVLFLNNVLQQQWCHACKAYASSSTYGTFFNARRSLC